LAADESTESVGGGTAGGRGRGRAEAGRGDAGGEMLDRLELTAESLSLSSERSILGANASPDEKSREMTFDSRGGSRGGSRGDSSAWRGGEMAHESDGRIVRLLRLKAGEYLGRLLGARHGDEDRRLGGGGGGAWGRGGTGAASSGGGTGGVSQGMTGRSQMVGAARASGITRPRSLEMLFRLCSTRA